MKVTALAIPEVLLIEPRVFADERGAFFESFNADDFAGATKLSPSFVQDNHSISVRGVLRGLHYQLPPHAQGKLVRVVRGEVFDVAVDLRRGSPTFGNWVGEMLSATNHRQLWVPEGFGHGFLATADAEFLYKTTSVYNSASERSIIWNDPDIGIAWPDIGMAPILSIKDAAAHPFSRAEVF